ncbi:MAG: Tyrosine recombinase XerD [Dehalococcoidia bacterium]|nr:Tyrosine recombinase XerD [Bacillota bacterium]MBT9143260.1 Tyrosine recombinase XerD [Bacillota bacterium]
MKNSTIRISELTNRAKDYLQSLDYHASTIQRYCRVWNKLILHSEQAGIIYYSYDSCYAILCNTYGIKGGEKQTSQQAFCLRTLKLMDEIYQQKEVTRCHKLSGIHVADCFSGFLGNYLRYQESLGIKVKTVRCKSIQMTRFLNYLHTRGLDDFRLLNADMILSYVKELNDIYMRNTVSGILFTLRNFLVFLYDSGLTDTPFQQLFPVIISNKLERVPSYYHEDEIKKVLEAVDRDIAIGKRDYLVLVLAIQLGIRAGDIRMMRLDYVYWNKRTIEFVQQKTGNPIQLPLPENIKYALIEYLRESRPKSESPYIFLRHRAPYEPYEKSNVFHYVITKYLDAAGINISNRRHGLHSMRHSLASSLLKNNTPYPVITGILGHESTAATRLYLNIDIGELRSVALDVPYEG